MDAWWMLLESADPRSAARARAALATLGVDELRPSPPTAPGPTAGPEIVVDLGGRIDPPAIATVLRRSGVEVLALRRLPTDPLTTCATQRIA